jgi:hypothetical protein
MLFCGKSCEDDSEQAKWQQKEIIAVKDSIRDEFEADYLTEEARYAAETNAIQELNDLADYVEIFTDASLDSLFREKAGEMIRGMFVSEDNMLSFGQLKNKKMKSVSLKEFLEEGFGKNVLSVNFAFDSIKVIQPLQKSGEESYDGLLSANQELIICAVKDSIVLRQIPVIVDFTSYKKQKIIGIDTLKVWAVSLRDIAE